MTLIPNNEERYCYIDCGEFNCPCKRRDPNRIMLRAAKKELTTLEEFNKPIFHQQDSPFILANEVENNPEFFEEVDVVVFSKFNKIEGILEFEGKPRDFTIDLDEKDILRVIGKTLKIN